MPLVWIALGSNLGDRAGHLCAAVEALQPALRSLEISPIYETRPMYVEDQPSFYNAVLVGDLPEGSGETPHHLLGFLKEIESRLGRQARQRFGPREIDLDILAFGDLHVETPELVLPHPRVLERPFVLRPLLDLPRRFLSNQEIEEALFKTENEMSAAGKPDTMTTVVDDRWLRIQQHNRLIVTSKE